MEGCVLRSLDNKLFARGVLSPSGLKYHLICIRWRLANLNLTKKSHLQCHQQKTLIFIFKISKPNSFVILYRTDHVYLTPSLAHF